MNWLCIEKLGSLSAENPEFFQLSLSICVYGMFILIVKLFRGRKRLGVVFLSVVLARASLSLAAILSSAGSLFMREMLLWYPESRIDLAQIYALLFIVIMDAVVLFTFLLMDFVVVSVFTLYTESLGAKSPIPVARNEKIG